MKHSKAQSMKNIARKSITTKMLSGALNKPHVCEIRQWMYLHGNATEIVCPIARDYCPLMPGVRCLCKLVPEKKGTVHYDHGQTAMPALVSLNSFLVFAVLIRENFELLDIDVNLLDNEDRSCGKCCPCCVCIFHDNEPKGGRPNAIATGLQ